MSTITAPFRGSWRSGLPVFVGAGLLLSLAAAPRSGNTRLPAVALPQAESAPPASLGLPLPPVDGHWQCAGLPWSFAFGRSDGRPAINIDEQHAVPEETVLPDPLDDRLLTLIRSLMTVASAGDDLTRYTVDRSDLRGAALVRSMGAADVPVWVEVCWPTGHGGWCSCRARRVPVRRRALLCGPLPQAELIASRVGDNGEVQCQLMRWRDDPLQLQQTLEHNGWTVGRTSPESRLADEFRAVAGSEALVFEVRRRGKDSCSVFVQRIPQRGAAKPFPAHTKRGSRS